MRLGLILDPRFTGHEAPAGHPERGARIEELQKRAPAWEADPGLIRLQPQAAREEQITRVHSRSHFERIEATRGQARSQLDSDTFTSSDSFEVARLAAGSGVALLNRMVDDRIDAGFLLARPPGHHAESGRAMGFCLFNNVAVAAGQALDSGAASKVAIVDFDVHHGNGTQEIFYSRSEVLYVSSHQSPLYPGTGRWEEVGAGPGRGFNVNLPLRAGRILFFLEGGYHLPALGDSVSAVIEAALNAFSPEAAPVEGKSDSGREPDGDAYLVEVARHFGAYWSALTRAGLNL